MKTQPDFHKMWLEHFGRTPKKVRYEIRQDSNRYHDLIFMNSLIHDARFRRSQVRLRGKRLTIPVNRDCWELYEDDPKPKLPVADARFSISPV